MKKSDRRGFTLIELLVVILIIGILAAVALPQYNKAVEKSTITHALALLKSLSPALDDYILTNGEMPSSFEDLAISVPDWPGNTPWYNGEFPTRSNDTWSLQLVPTGIYLGRISGPYKGSGFVYYAQPNLNMPIHQILCVERITAGISFDKENGPYCEKFLHATSIGTIGSVDAFTLN